MYMRAMQEEDSRIGISGGEVEDARIDANIARLDSY